jgi:hypothetical protein
MVSCSFLLYHNLFIFDKYYIYHPYLDFYCFKVLKILQKTNFWNVLQIYVGRSRKCGHLAKGRTKGTTRQRKGRTPCGHLYRSCDTPLWGPWVFLRLEKLPKFFSASSNPTRYFSKQFSCLHRNLARSLSLVIYFRFLLRDYSLLCESFTPPTYFKNN